MRYFNLVGVLTGSIFEHPVGLVSILADAGSATLRIVNYGNGLTTDLAVGSGQIATVGETSSHIIGRTPLGSASAPESLLDEVLAATVSGSGEALASSISTYLATGGHSGSAADVLATQAGGQTYLFVAGNSDSGLRVFHLAADGSLAEIGNIEDSSQTYADGIAAMARITTDSGQFLYTGSGTEHGLDIWRITDDGTLSHTGSLGRDQNLPVQSVTAIEPVTLAGQSFLVIAAAGSSSLTVFRVEPDGTLVPTDHVIDTLHTRFQNATVLEVIEKDGQIFVLVAGSDDGISLFTLIPDGRLVHIESIEDANNISLQNVSGIETCLTGDIAQVFVTSGAEGGVTQFELDLSGLGTVAIGQSGQLLGTEGDDTLVMQEAGEVIGGDGDDIILDGAGTNTLAGGEGADVFVLTADGMNDTIIDFEPGIDRIDLSFLPMLYAWDQLQITYTGDGAVVVFRDEVLTIVTADGLPLTEDDFRNLDIVSVSHARIELEAPPPDPDTDLVLVGTDGKDFLEGMNGNDYISGLVNADTLIGGAGSDTLLGGTGNDLLDGGNQDDELYGEGGRDTLLGGSGADTLNGGADDDTLDGGGDADLLAGGSGADGMDGGDGGDMFLVDGLDTVTDTGATGFDRAQVDGTAGVSLTLGGWSGVERVSGNTGNDTIDASGYTTAVILNGGGGNDTLVGNGQGAILLGGAGDDRLTGGAGNDTLQGATGSDTFDGGAGSDTFFIGETGDVVQDSGTTGYDRAMIDNAAGVSLALGGWSGVERIDGHTGNDTIDATGYATALTLTGGEGGDVLTGGAAGDALYGGEGNDTLNGGGGSDALNGGLGADVFEFGAGFGQDVIGDFENGTDLIDFSGHGGVSSTADLVITQDGDNTVITLAAGGTDRITLTDTLATAIDAADFIFP
jgi:serralysin